MEEIPGDYIVNGNDYSGQSSNAASSRQYTVEPKLGH